MDVYTSSSGLQHVVGYGPHSVVIAHQNHNHHNDYNHNHYHSLPPRSLPKAASSYELVPVVPTAIYVPVQPQKQKQQQQLQQRYHGNHR
jgi:hypothetical protein